MRLPYRRLPLQLRMWVQDVCDPSNPTRSLHSWRTLIPFSRIQRSLVVGSAKSSTRTGTIGRYPSSSSAIQAQICWIEMDHDVHVVRQPQIAMRVYRNAAGDEVSNVRTRQRSHDGFDGGDLHCASSAER